jgi:hypothetical protein
MFNPQKLGALTRLSVEWKGVPGGTKAVVALYFHRLAGMGGAERMVCLLANALVARGFAVHVFSCDEPGAEPFYNVSPEVKLSASVLVRA